MQKPLLLSLTLSTLFVFSHPCAQAQEVPKAERDRVSNIGVLGGAALGAIAGGPPGAIVTAAFGGWISDKVLVGRENRLLKQHLAATDAQMQALQDDHVELQLDLARAEKTLQQRQQLASTNAPTVPVACCGDSELVLHFRSNSDQVETLYDEALEHFVASASSLHNPVIEIIGHADRRGANAENLALSQRRVGAVETRLRAMGLRNVSYQTVAHGELTPASTQASTETNFFDRRVELRIAGSGASRVSMK